MYHYWDGNGKKRNVHELQRLLFIEILIESKAVITANILTKTNLYEDKLNALLLFQFAVALELQHIQFNIYSSLHKQRFNESRKDCFLTN